ncbi:hypothetical protein [Halobacterium yunchengense]|uniref:hypothetical protein n=1 Tax=Halobacterium yunchengense TaxID=3108497 RepID=UPI00300BB970
MQRRNVLAAVGSLAATSAAAIGTGAFTSVSANRSLSVEVADDADALLGLVVPDSLGNGEYATCSNVGSTDQLVLNFDEDATVAGSGVNDDALSRFDSVFRVENHGTQFVRLGVDKTGLGEPGRWDFYPYGDGVTSYPNWDEGYVGPGISTGGSMPVGVRVDARDPEDELAGGSITITARA